MKRMFRFSIVAIAFIIMAVIACNRKKPEFIGPAYIAAPEGLSVISFTTSTIPPTGVDFVLAKVTFNASFTATATWMLTIVGHQSGATYQATGTGNGFSNLIWGGSHTGLVFFRSGETVTATLSFVGSSLTKSYDILIKRQANFNSCQGAYYAKNADFETPAQVLPPSGNWESFNYPGAIVNVEQGITGVDSVNFSGDRYGNKVPAVQGKNYYYIRGFGDAPSFVSGLRFAKILKADSVYFSSDPNEVWFNVYIYGTGDVNAGLDIEFQEAKNSSDNGYDAKTGDSWVYHMELKHTGWKLFSFKYSDLTITTNPDLGGSGNKIMEPKKLRAFDFVLLKKLNPNAPVEVFLDYPLFTIGGPFIPCK